MLGHTWGTNILHRILEDQTPGVEESLDVASWLEVVMMYMYVLM